MTLVLRLIILSTIILGCYSQYEISTQASSYNFVKPAPPLPSLSVPEALWFLGIMLYFLISMFEHSQNVKIYSKWSKVARVFPSYQLWRGHFNPNDKISPSQICLDWSPKTNYPATEEEINHCWYEMWDTVGDKTAVGDFHRLRLVAIVKIVLRVFVLLMGLWSAITFLNSPVVQQPSKNVFIDSDNNCQIMSDKVYENLDNTATYCTGNSFGHMCELRCKPGYKRSWHYGSVALCGLTADSKLLWIPSGLAYQKMCEPDLIHSVPNLAFLYGDWDKPGNKWMNMVDNADPKEHAHIEYLNGEQLVADASNSVPKYGLFFSSKKDQEAVVGRDLLFGLDFFGGKSLIAEHKPFIKKELSVFTVLQLREFSWASISKVHNFVKFDALNQALLTSLVSAISPPTGTNCFGGFALYSLFVETISATKGIVHVRVNGVPISGAGIHINVDVSTVVPLFATGASPVPIKFGKSSATDLTPFNGKVAQVIVYNHFLDPTKDDSLNLRKIESIEWLLASNWTFSEVISPAKPDTPVLINQNINDTKVDVLFQFTAQGAGYQDLPTFSQEFKYKRVETTTELGNKKLDIGQTGIKVKDLDVNNSYEFWIESKINDVCRFVNNGFVNKGEPTTVSFHT